jgi:hypothetical protein
VECFAGEELADGFRCTDISEECTSAVITGHILKDLKLM